MRRRQIARRQRDIGGGTLLERRRAFQADDASRRAFLASLGVEVEGRERLISLFAYENPALASWLDALAQDAQPTLLLVPEGRVLGDVADWLGLPGLAPGDRHRRGNLRLQVLPFVRQEDYDLLLWSCDVNAVRGEDSFVRALWAGRPFVWHIYEQEEGVHLEKLDAFLSRYLSDWAARKADAGTDAAPLSHAAREALRTFWHLWNGYASTAPDWPALAAALPELQRYARVWANAQATLPDLARQLASFAENQVK